MNNQDEVKEKQEFLRIHILEKGYDADEFMEFLETLKGEKGLKIENWSKNDLIDAVQQFTLMNNQNKNNINNNIENKKEKSEIIAINENNENNFNDNDNNNHKIEQEFLQCKLTEKNGISSEQNLNIIVSEPKLTEGNFFSKSYLTYLIETNPLGFKVRRRFNDFIWLHDILK